MMSKCLLGLGGRLEGKRLVKWDGGGGMGGKDS